MAKTRAQRKAERRAREAEERKRSDGGRAESRAQHDTQVGVSGEVAEIEAVEARHRRRRSRGADRDSGRPEALPFRAPGRSEGPERGREAQAGGAEAARERAARQEAETGEDRTSAWRGHRLPGLLLAGVEKSPVAGPRHADPGHRRHHHLRRRSGRLPGRPRRSLQLPHQADPVAGSPNKGFHFVSLVRHQHLLRAREQGQAQPRAPRRDDEPAPQRAAGRRPDRAGLEVNKDGQKESKPRNGRCPATSSSTWR